MEKTELKDHIMNTDYFFILFPKESKILKNSVSRYFKYIFNKETYLIPFDEFIERIRLNVYKFNDNNIAFIFLIENTDLSKKILDYLSIYRDPKPEMFLIYNCEDLPAEIKSRIKVRTDINWFMTKIQSFNEDYFEIFNYSH